MNYDDYPWYFETLGALDILEITKNSVVINLVDTCVNFDLEPLKGKNYFQENEKCDFSKEEIELLHGTAMAGVIAASHSKLKLEDDHFSVLNVAGIAPNCLIKNIIGKINPDNIKSVVDSEIQCEIEEESEECAFPLTKDQKRTQPILINLSGGQKRPNDLLREDWYNIIKNICINEKDVLIITSVGNSAENITKQNFMDKGIYPSCLNIKSCKNNDIDPIIRVGATNKYLKGEKPDLYQTAISGSNYGTNFVDILAPGKEIPIITPTGYAKIAGGTSESAAIVSAVAAQVISCRPYITSQDLRNAILDHADNYSHLEKYVSNGKVLNAQKVVTALCQESIPNKVYNSEWDNVWKITATMVAILTGSLLYLRIRK